MLAVFTTGTLVKVEMADQSASVNWIAFGLFATLLIVGETKTALWMRFGNGGEVTPGYAFAYALALLGSPAGAVAVMAFTSAYVDIRSRKPLRKVLFNVADISLALSTGGLVLHAFGIQGAITDRGSIPLTWGIGILAGGTMVFVMNGMLVCLVLALHTGNGFLATMREGFALSMTADGALLALAPLFVVAVEFSLVLLPLLGVTSFLVFQSARHALQRAHEANHDSLTKLLNRRSFSDRLTELLETDGPLDGAGALLLLDLDGFKEINDRLGHQVGDSLLQGFAERLEREMPEGAFAARLGGDEFAVLLPGATDMQSTKLLAFDLHSRLCRPLMVNGLSVVGLDERRPGVRAAPRRGVGRPARRRRHRDVPRQALPNERRGLPDQFEHAVSVGASGCSPTSRRRSTTTSSTSTTNPSSTWRPDASTRSRRCCGGTTLASGRCRPTSSSVSPSRPS